MTSIARDYPTETLGEILQGVHAEGRLDGLMLAMTLRQHYRNDSRHNIEAVYTFPLAHGATLLGLQVEIGGKRMRAQVIGAHEARERFEDAIDAGDTPVMVEQTGSGLYTANLGNLLPGESLTVELEYAQLLRFEQGRIRLVVPTTLAPRYGDAVKQGGLAPHQVTTPDLFAEHAFDFAITLLGPVAQLRLLGPPPLPISCVSCGCVSEAQAQAAP
jgi:Ca-activated chloride channel family protein